VVNRFAAEYLDGIADQLYSSVLSDILTMRDILLKGASIRAVFNEHGIL
jgi:hypothetical protein